MDVVGVERRAVVGRSEVVPLRGDGIDPRLRAERRRVVVRAERVAPRAREVQGADERAKVGRVVADLADHLEGVGGRIERHERLDAERRRARDAEVRAADAVEGAVPARDRTEHRECEYITRCSSSPSTIQKRIWRNFSSFINFFSNIIFMNDLVMIRFRKILRRIS